MWPFRPNYAKQAEKLNELLAENKKKREEESVELHKAARARIDSNKLKVATIEDESLALIDSIRDLPPLPEPVPEQTVNKLFEPDKKVPTLKDNFKVIGHIGKKILGRGNTVLSDNLNKLTNNIK